MPSEMPAITERTPPVGAYAAAILTTTVAEPRPQRKLPVRNKTGPIQPSLAVGGVAVLDGIEYEPMLPPTRTSKCLCICYV